MKIQKDKKTSSNKAMLSVLLFVILLLGLGTYYWYQKNNINHNNSPTTSEKATDTSPQPNVTPTTPETKQTPTNTDKPTEVKQDATSKNKAMMSVSANISAGTVYIRGGIDNAVVTDGTCYAQLTGPSNETLRKDTSLLQNPSTTDCKTISISTTTLSKGTWRATLHYSSSTMEGVSSEATFEIQ